MNFYVFELSNLRIFESLNRRIFEFSMSDGTARRGAQPGAPSGPSRPRLGKRQWQEIRRAQRLGDEGGLYAVEIHGVKLFFRIREKAHPEPAPQENTPCGKAPANWKRPGNPLCQLEAGGPGRKPGRELGHGGC